MDTETKAQEFFIKCGISGFDIISGCQEGWRTRAKLAVRQVNGKIKIGLFQEGSHEIEPVSECQDHHPRINESLEKIASFLAEEHITGYNEATHKGDVRYLQCVVERRTGRVQVSFVLNCPLEKAWKVRLENLYKKNPDLWHSFWINVQLEQTNTIFGKEWHHVIGEKYIWELIAGYEVPFLPSHFGQANLEMFERLLQDMLHTFPHDMHVAELFSGIGIISILLRSISRSITLYEIEPSAKDSFTLLQKQLPLHLQNACEFVVGDANRAHEVCERATAVIVDPPRKGVSKEILDTVLRQKNIQYFLYISCCWKTFERDAELLLAGGFSAKYARSYKFFPGTDHLETMCLFYRVSLAPKRID